ncbi:LegC family aminotransferase [Oceaniserpentilla sp. 4NH20-0058]|uniref:LegC family aminotransferase n=1 Tax=Oceaniserpentilla sp. 4NH20-0058 TaxID=3127660 RepID=UPI0031087BE5
MIESFIEFVRDTYKISDLIPLHAPTFNGNEKAYLNQTIDSTFVSSVGKFVDEFENKIEGFTGASKAVATVNGTAALNVALHMAGVERGDLVITQALTFVATCNALYHMGVEPVFVDVSKISLGLCPASLEVWLNDNADINDSGKCIHKSTGKRLSAVVPMHTFGHPVELDELLLVCEKWNLVLIEDAAESLGSFYKGRHTGTFGKFSAISFNGNKVITTGGGGMVLCRDEQDGKRVKHLTTTAKVPHPYEFYHDEPGFNYRLPNLNAALGCAQMEVLGEFLAKKRLLADSYRSFFNKLDATFVVEPEYAKSNYWLNSIIIEDKSERDRFLEVTNSNNIMTRPVWKLMNTLPAFSNCIQGNLDMSISLEKSLINLPSTPIIKV